MLKYQELAARLRDRLMDKKRSPDGRLPPMSVLVQEENCSLSTVHRAVQELKKEGLIVSRAGKGTFLASRAPKGMAPEGGGHDGRYANEEASTGLPVRFIAFDQSSALLKDPLGLAAFTGLQQLLASKGHPIQYHNTVIQRELIPLSPEVLAQKVHGTVCYAPFNDPFLERLVEQCRPMVCIDRDATRFGVDSIVMNNREGAHLATASLFEMGHERIVWIGSEESESYGPGADPAVRERYQGYVDAHRVRGKEVNPRFCISPASRRSDRVAAAFKSFLSRKPRFTAVLSYDGSVANTVLGLLEDKGIRVPRDCSVAAAGAADPNSRIAGTYFDLKGLATQTWQLLEEARSRVDAAPSPRSRAKARLGKTIMLPGVFEPRASASK